LTAFFDQVVGLGPKLGGVLVQLPPSLAFEARLAGRFFAMLRRRTRVRVACEPRHPGWFTPAADVILVRHAVARVASDPAPIPAAARPGGAGAPARWRYWRWHGAPRIYYSAYEDPALRELARSLANTATTRAPAS